MSYKYRKTFSYCGKRYDVKADSQEELLQKITEKKYLLSKGINKESNIKTHDYAEMWLENYNITIVVSFSRCLFAFPRTLQSLRLRTFSICFYF